MHFLLEWCVAQIKKLLARLSSAEANIGYIRTEISSITFVAAGNLPLSGAGDPEGVETGGYVGQLYLRADGTKYYFNGTPGTTIGWTF